MRQTRPASRPRTPEGDGAGGITRQAPFSGVISRSSYPPGGGGRTGAGSSAWSSEVSAAL